MFLGFGGTDVWIYPVTLPVIFLQKEMVDLKKAIEMADGETSQCGDNVAIWHRVVFHSEVHALAWWHVFLARLDLLDASGDTATWICRQCGKQPAVGKRLWPMVVVLVGNWRNHMESLMELVSSLSFN